jgi:hypothetical protein
MQRVRLRREYAFPRWLLFIVYGYQSSVQLESPVKEVYG